MCFRTLFCIAICKYCKCNLLIIKLLILKVKENVGIFPFQN